MYSKSWRRLWWGSPQACERGGREAGCIAVGMHGTQSVIWRVAGTKIVSDSLGQHCEAEESGILIRIVGYAALA